MDVRSDGLDAGPGCDEEVMNPIDLTNFDPVGCDPVASPPEPSQAELAQCQAEVGTLLSIIAELNKKMGGLKLPRESEDLRPPGPDRPLVPHLLTHGLASGRNTAPGTTSEPPVTSRGGSVNVWSDLQGALSAVENSISSRRTWAVPLTASDQDKQTEHRMAAQESWVQATQMLEEMEREFGVTYPSGLPSEERRRYRGAVLDLHRDNCALRGALRRRQEEREATQSAVSQMEEERSRLREKLVGLYQVWRSGSLSPPPSSSSSSSGGGALSPDVASPPFPASPLLARRPRRSFSASSAGEDVSLSSGIASLGSPCSSANLESETERMHRCIERLKSRNEHLTAALERRKGESEQISMTLSRHEADSSALQMALRYCEECEEVYSELLSLNEERKRQGLSLWTEPAESVCDDGQWPDIPGSQHRNLKTEELSTSFLTAGGSVESETQSHTRQRSSELVEREAALRQQIEHLREDRAAVCLPKPGPGGEGKLSPDTGTLARTRGGHTAKDDANPNDTKRERAALLHELVSVREEMSELRGLIRLTEKERRCLDWSLMAQKAQDAAGALISESLGEELEDRKAEQQTVAENVAKLVNDGNLPGPRNRTLLRELQAVLQREQGLKRRISTVRDSLDTALSDSASRRKDSEEQIMRLVQAHCKATGLYRNARRKYREQLWRLENKMSAMSDSHHSQIGALKATLEAMEWRREETIL